MFNGLLKEWERIVKQAKANAATEGWVEEVEECPVCFVVGAVSKGRKKLAYCHLCESKLEYAPCMFCGGLTLDTYPYIKERGAEHSRCIERAMEEVKRQSAG